MAINQDSAGPSRVECRVLIAVFVAVTLLLDSLSGAEDEPVDAASRLGKRLTLQTPPSDELLFMLEEDFVTLLRKSRHLESLLDAEDLLAATNDNSHWTNYSAATRILKTDRDLAAIPLLLRYIVLHAKRSSSHVMIPEYQKTITVLSGHELPPLYESGPDLEVVMRAKVLKLFNEWWRPERDRLVIDPDKMSPGQLQVLAGMVLREVRERGDFTGSGGAPDTAYGAYHNVYYKVLDKASSELIDSPLHPSMIAMILGLADYRADGEPAGATKPFPYETIPILAEFVKNGEEAAIGKIADDKSQNAAVRMTCILALYRAGHPFRTAQLLGLLEAETDFERRLIILLSLRWAGADAVPVLLANLDDPNIEIATAAGCALTEVKPKEAMPRFARLLDRHHAEMPLLLLGAMAEYKVPESRELLTRMLSDAVEGRKNGPHLYRLISAFADGWEIPASVYRTDDDRDYVLQGKLALAHSREMIGRWQAEKRTLEAAVASLGTQLTIAREIENLRRKEYQRLVTLQIEEIATPEDSQKALDHVKAVADEVEALRAKLALAEEKLENIKRTTGAEADPNQPG